MNLQGQIDYWVGNAKDDIVTSELLITIIAFYMVCFGVI